MSQTVRAHVVLPKELLDRIDALVGKRRRSEFIAESMEEIVRREVRSRLAHSLMGSIKEGEVPEWDTVESTLAWQRAQRPIDDPWKEALGEDYDPEEGA